MRIKPTIPALPQTHPDYAEAWYSYWQEKSRWQDQEIDSLTSRLKSAEALVLDLSRLVFPCDSTEVVKLRDRALELTRSDPV